MLHYAECVEANYEINIMELKLIKIKHNHVTSDSIKTEQNKCQVGSYMSYVRSLLITSCHKRGHYCSLHVTREVTFTSYMSQGRSLLLPTCHKGGHYYSLNVTRALLLTTHYSQFVTRNNQTWHKAYHKSSSAIQHPACSGVEIVCLCCKLCRLNNNARTHRLC